MGHMTLQIKNFQTIKQAKINLEGLAVIGGENSTGKSSVGKILMSIIKTVNKHRSKSNLDQNKTFESYLMRLFDGNWTQLFGGNAHTSPEILICKNDEPMIEAKLQEGRFDFCSAYSTNHLKPDFLDCTLIQTSFVWDLQDFFTDLVRIQQDQDSDFFGAKISYPYALYDLYLKLTMQRYEREPSIQCHKVSKQISGVIGGTMTRGSDGKYSFFDSSENRIIPLLSTASGIKVFGILQNLIAHHYVNPQGYFIFDEPENHLHPMWQVEFARVVVELIKGGVKMMINTHSPYLLEALQKLKEAEDLQNINFYLAHDHSITQIDEDNDRTLEEIFSLLNQSFERMDQIDIQRIQNRAIKKRI